MKSVTLEHDSFWRWRLVVVDSGNVVQDRMIRGPRRWATRIADKETHKLEKQAGEH